MVAGWIIVGIVLIAIIVIFKIAGKLGKGVGIAFGVLILFLAITVGIFVTQPGVTEIDGLGDFVNTGKVYFLWIGTIFNNVGDVTGYAVGLDWNDPLEEEFPDQDEEDENDKESLLKLN